MTIDCARFPNELECQSPLPTCARCGKPGSSLTPLIQRVRADWHPDCWERHEAEMREYDRIMGIDRAIQEQEPTP